MKSIILFFLIFVHRLPIGRIFRRKKMSSRILIVKIDAIGDSIIWLNSAKEYKKHFPNHTLVLCYKKDWEDIALKLRYFDEFIAFDQKRFFKSIAYRFSLLKQLNTYHYEIVINPTFSRNFFLQDWIINNIHADTKIGSIGEYCNTNNTIAKLTHNFEKYNPKLKAIADRWYTRLITTSAEPKMELIRNAEFIREYLNPQFQATIPKFPFPIEKNDKVPFEKYIIFVMGSSTERKSWETENFASVAAKLIDNYNIVVCGNKNESVLYEKLITYNFGDKHILNLCGKTNLTELISIINDADFIITNDTAASHICVATQTSSICILGGGHFGRFHPYEIEKLTDNEKLFLPKIVYHKMNCFGCGWICKYPLENGKWKCIKNIDSKIVIDKIHEIIEYKNYK